MTVLLKAALKIGIASSLVYGVVGHPLSAFARTISPAAQAKTATEIPLEDMPSGATEDFATEDFATENFATEDFTTEDFAETSALPFATTAMSELTEPDGTTVILPPGYEAGQSYPALVLLPYTDRTALHMFNWGMYDAYRDRTENAFIVIMPPGQGSSANWSGYGWEAIVNEYESYIQQDLGAITAKYNVDQSQMVLGGFSLGGDMTWALSLRNPGLFSGAIVMGSMSTYRNEQNAQLLAQQDFRYFMVMGGYDGNRDSMYSALDVLDANAIDYHYEEVSNAGHGDLPEQMEHDLFLSAMDYVLRDRPSSETTSENSIF